MKRWIALVAAWLITLALCSALAEDDVFVIALDEMTEDTVCCVESYVRMTCTLDDVVSVSLSIHDDQENLVYQRNYGQCSGFFRTEDVYLRLTSGETIYHATMRCGETVYAKRIVRKLPRLVNNAACAAGYPITKLAGVDSRHTVTMLDTAALAQQPMTVAMHASGYYELGTVTFAMKDGYLIVTAALNDSVDGEITSGMVYVAASSVAAESLGFRQFAGMQGPLGTMIDLQGESYAAVYVQLTVSFDPGSAATGPVIELPGQDELWQKLLEQTENEAVG